jgi:release factor glutamine methyltransferase
MLNPAAQLRIVNEWLDDVPERQTIRVDGVLSEQFFRDRSEGEYAMKARPLYKLHSTTPTALAKMRSHKKPYDASVSGLPILVLPNVWSPAYDWSSAFYVENMPDVSGKSFLEIGCGTGVISVFAARAGAFHVTATDVNEDAVKNAKLNFERFGITNAEALVSDGFAKVRGKFEIVTWNAPYHGSKPANVLERGCTDEDYRDITKFFQNVGTYLTPNGIVVFGFSESGDLPLIESLIFKNGFYIKRKLSDWRQDYNCLLFHLAPVKTQP